MTWYWAAIFANLFAVGCNLYAMRLQYKTRNLYKRLICSELNAYKIPFTQQQLDEIIAREKLRMKK